MSSKPAPGPSSVLRGHRAEVQALCCHPSRRLLYSGCGAKLATESLVKFSQNVIATRSCRDSQGEAKAWDLTTERAIWSQRLHPTEAGVTAIHLSGADYSTLLSQGRNGTIKQWAMSAEGLPSRDPLQHIETGSYNFCGMAVFSLEPHAFQKLSTINQKLTSRQTDEAFLGQEKGARQPGSTIRGTEKLCSNSAEPEQEHKSAADEEPAANVTETTRQESIIAIAGHDPAVLEIWSVAGLTIPGCPHNNLHALSFLDYVVPASCPSAHNHTRLDLMLRHSRAASLGSSPCVVKVSKSGAIVQHLTQPEGSKHGMCMAVQLYVESRQDTLHALVGYEDGTVAVWDVAAGHILASKQLHAEPVMAVAVADGSGGICAAADNKVQCFCLGPTSTLLTVLVTLEVKQHGIADICIRPDQRLFATAGWDGKVRLFHYRKMRPLAVLQYHRKGVTALAFQPHNQCLVSASRDGTIAIWSVFQPGREIS